MERYELITRVSAVKRYAHGKYMSQQTTVCEWTNFEMKNNEIKIIQNLVKKNATRVKKKTAAF